MHVRVCTCVSINVSVCCTVHLCEYIYVSVCTCMSVCLWVRLCVSKYVRERVRVCLNDIMCMSGKTVKIFHSSKCSQMNVSQTLNCEHSLCV